MLSTELVCIDLCWLLYWMDPKGFAHPRAACAPEHCSNTYMATSTIGIEFFSIWR